MQIFLKKLIVTTMNGKNIIVTAAEKNRFMMDSCDVLQYNFKCHYGTRLMMLFRRQTLLGNALQSYFWFTCISRPNQHLLVQM